jgi:hypothetical protein
MAEKKQVRIVIAEDGSISCETHGIKGKQCLDLLEELLKDITIISDPDLQPDYYEDPDTAQIDTTQQQNLESGQS